MRGRRWVPLLGLAIVVIGGCSGEARSIEKTRADEVCRLLSLPLTDVGPFPFTEPELTVGGFFARIAGADESIIDVVVYLEPGTGGQEVASALALVEETVDTEVELVTAEEAAVEFEERFGDEQSGIFDAVDESSLPSSIRFETDDPADVGRVTDRLRDLGAPVFRVIDSRSFAATSIGSIALFAPDLLDRLESNELDVDVAEAARTLIDAGVSAAEPVEASVREAVAVLADRAAACGVVDRAGGRSWP